MVRTVNRTPDNPRMERPPLVVELVGPAGAGKTTVLRALTQRNKRILVGAPPDVRRIGHIPFFVSNAVLLVPTFLRLLSRNSRWLTRLEIEWMVILKGWHHVLGGQVSNSSSVVILDQGPVFMLAMLHVFGPESLKSQIVEKWWSNMYSQWASALDMIVWLDASDAILMERIRARKKWHMVKEKSEQEVKEFLARFQTSYEQMIAKLTTNCGPRVLRLDTKQDSLDQVVEKVLAAFDSLEPDES